MSARCTACVADEAVLRNQHRRNERRNERGLPPVLDEIERVKAHMADCAARGHHDPKAGPASRYREVATSP